MCKWENDAPFNDAYKKVGKCKLLYHLFMSLPLVCMYYPT